MIGQSLSSRVLIVGSIISLGTLVFTLLFGRAWCGWICPVGSVLDVLPLGRTGKPKHPPEIFRRGKYILLFVILAGALLGNLTWMYLDPMTIWVRTFTGSIWPAVDVIISTVEGILANVPFLADPIQWLDQLLRRTILPMERPAIQAPWLPALLFLVIVFLNIFAERFWCRYICPLGGLLGLVSKVALFQRSVSGECKGCTICERVCPTGTIDPSGGYQSDPAECTMCMNCIPVCSRISTQFKPGWRKPIWNVYDPNRRMAIESTGVAIAATALLSVEQDQKQTKPFLIRPPGVDEEIFLSKCLRCGECVRGCPTGALQPSISEGGLIGLFTPVLVARTGYCLHSCNRCGEICPVEAIPPLALEEKHQQVIGWAFIDENRCIPYVDGMDCIVCEEMCPVSNKAIVLEEVSLVSPVGDSIIVRQPKVKRELCIGCGICEYKCPREGESAIRVYRNDF
jgi:polyferredoxin